MVTLIDPILTMKPPAEGIELQPLREPESMDSRMEVKAVKRNRSFDWVGSRSAMRGIVRQMQKYGWTVIVREEHPA